MDAERNPGLNGVASRKSSPAAIETEGGSRSRPSTRGAPAVATASPTPTGLGGAEIDKEAREHRPPPKMAEGGEAVFVAAEADGGEERARMLADGKVAAAAGVAGGACETWIAYLDARGSDSITFRHWWKWNS